MVGKTLSHFRILERIGEGGMGVVYRAEDQKLRRPVALKTLHPDRVGDEDRRRRFLREARAAAAVAHPNIATIYEIDEIDRTIFIAMELIEGETLRALLESRQRLPVFEALGIASQIADAMTRAHEARLVHRDLKPENIVVGPAGHLKILDFGLAKPLPERTGGAGSTESETLAAELTGEGAMIGTACYMSPEQVRGRPADVRSDLFSIGILLYEMLTGKPPFRGATAMDTVSAILRDEPIPAADLCPEMPRDLGRILDQLLAKEPEHRYPSARRLALALRGLHQRLIPSLRAPGTALSTGAQAKLCICGRSQNLPYCDGRHASEDWTCATGAEAVRFAFCAVDRYQNLARKLAAHYRGVTCLRDEPCPSSEILIVIVDGTDLEHPLQVYRTAQATRRIVVSLGVAADRLRGLFQGSEMVDLSDTPPLYAFKRLSAVLDAGDVAPAAESAEPQTGLRSAFISHAVADEPLILPVKDFLQSYYRADVFTCADSIDPGTEWQSEIMQALRKRERFILALSEASLASHFCSFEIGVAAALEKPISILSLDGSLPPVFVQHLQSVDLERIQRSRAWLDKPDILLDEILKVLA